MIKLIYISGKYSDHGRDDKNKARNIELARIAAVKIWNMGASVICPHANTSFFDEDLKCTLSYDEWIEGDCRQVEGCDAVYMLPNWKESEGSDREKKYAESLGIPIFLSLKELEKFIKHSNHGHNHCQCCDQIKRPEFMKNKYNLTICLFCEEIITKAVNNHRLEVGKNFLLIPRNT